jgi:hypothetical protein
MGVLMPMTCGSPLPPAFSLVQLYMSWAVSCGLCFPLSPRTAHLHHLQSWDLCAESCGFNLFEPAS